MGLVTKVMTLLPIATRVLDVGLLDCWNQSIVSSIRKSINRANLLILVNSDEMNVILLYLVTE
jgi:ribosome recycling factor